MIYCYVNSSFNDETKNRDIEGMERKVVPLTQFDAGAVGGAEPLRTPLYHQIYVVLRHQIADGSLKEGDVLPGELDLAELYGVSRITVKRALDELAKDGLVKRERGRGTSVSAVQPPSPMRASFEGQMEDLLAMGLETQVELLELDYRPASEEVAQALSCELGAEVQHSVRVRHAKGAPFSYLTTFVPADIGRSFRAEDLANRPLLALMEDCGVRVASAEQTITATLADAVTGRRLDTMAGAPLTKVTRIVYDITGNPVEYITALYRPDRYQYRMTLTRQETASAKIWSPSNTGYQLS